MQSPVERQASLGRKNSSSAESRIPKPGSSSKKPTKAFGSGIPRFSLEKSRSTSGDLKSARSSSTGLSDAQDRAESAADRVLVTVRMRPLRFVKSITTLASSRLTYSGADWQHIILLWCTVLHVTSFLHPCWDRGDVKMSFQKESGPNAMLSLCSDSGNEDAQANTLQ